MEENNNLTPREQEILNLLMEGVAPKEIAYKTRISIKTVAFHRTNIYRKTGIKNKYELKAKYSALNKLPEDKIAQQPVIIYQNKKILIPAVLLIAVIFIFSIWFIFIKPNLFMTRGKTPQEPVFIDRTFRILNLKSSRWNNTDNGSYGQTYSSSHSIKLKDFYSGSFDDLIPNAFEWYTLRISGISETKLEYVKLNIFLVPYGGGDWIIIGGGDNGYVSIGPGYFSEEIQINKFFNETPEFPAGEIIFELGSNLFYVNPNNPGLNFDTGLRIPDNIPDDRIMTFIQDFKIEPVINN